MNYQDYIKYDPEKKQYTDSYGYVIDGYSSKALGVEQRAQQPAKVNRITLVDTDTGIDPIVSATGSDTVNLILDAKSAVKTTNSFIVGSACTNQAQITTSSNAVTFQGVGTDSLINLEFLPKNASGYVKFGSNYTKYISIMGGGTTKITTSQGTNVDIDLTLESKGTGKLILTSNNPSLTQKESLDLSVDNGFSTFTSSSATPATYPNGDIGFIPRGIGAVTSTGPIVSSYGYFCAKRTSPKVLSSYANYIEFDTVDANTFGSSYWTNSNRFTNLSGKTIKVMAQGFAFPVAVPAGGSGESMFELYNSSNTLIGRYGRVLYYWVNNSSPYNGVSPCGTFIMAPNDYIKFNIYCSAGTWTMIGGPGVPGDYNNLTISQIP
jgi:hypothetical protein